MVTLQRRFSARNEARNSRFQPCPPQHERASHVQREARCPSRCTHANSSLEQCSPPLGTAHCRAEPEDPPPSRRGPTVVRHTFEEPPGACWGVRERVLCKCQQQLKRTHVFSTRARTPHSLQAALQKARHAPAARLFFDSARRRAAAVGGTYLPLGCVHSLAARLVLRGFLRARELSGGFVAALRARVPQPLTPAEADFTRHAACANSAERPVRVLPPAHAGKQPTRDFPSWTTNCERLLKSPKSQLTNEGAEPLT